MLTQYHLDDQLLLQMNPDMVIIAPHHHRWQDSQKKPKGHLKNQILSLLVLLQRKQMQLTVLS